jgi:hypothetical protein
MRAQYRAVHASTLVTVNAVADAEINSLLGAVVDMVAPVPRCFDGIVVLPLVRRGSTCLTLNEAGRGVLRGEHISSQSAGMHAIPDITAPSSLQLAMSTNTLAA